MRKLALASLFVFTCLASHSQIHFGVKGGLLLSKFEAEGNPTASYSNLFGSCTGGIFLILSPSERLSIQPELNYALIKAKDRFTATTMDLSYIQFPVLLKYNTRIDNFSIFAGPQLGFLVNAKRKLAGQSKSISSEITNTDLGITIGANYITSMGVYLAAQFTSGQLDVIKNEYNNNFNTRNKTASFTIGYVWGKGKK